MTVVFVLFTKENEMDGAHINNGRHNAYRNLVGRVHSEDLGLHGRIILK
jgi:formate dehydrogenase assembly factor FdhD